MKSRLRLAALAAGAALAAVLGACSLFDYSGTVVKRYALVYGITAYVHPLPSNAYNDPNLTYPAADAADVASLLAAHGYTVRSRWVDGDGSVWVDGVRQGLLAAAAADAPSKDRIAADLAAIGGQLGPNDQLLLFFSGHGMQDASFSPSVEYIVPSGAIASEEGWSGGQTVVEYYGNEAASISDTELGAMLDRAIPSARRIVILDTCNSGGFIGRGLDVDTTPSTTDPNADPRLVTLATVNTLAAAVANYASFSTTSATGISPYNATVLSAAGADEESFDDAGHAHGAMSYYLLRICDGGTLTADLNGDGAITVREAFSFVKAGLQENWNKVNPGCAFTPHVSGGPVDLVLF
jgi:hypothetical protein